jgi:hypothetical protein
MLRFLGLTSGTSADRGPLLIRATAFWRHILAAPRNLASALRAASARKRAVCQVGDLDPHPLEDAGLEPFDTFYGWRGAGTRR